MGIRDFLKKQFIDVIHWTEDADGVLAYRFPMEDFEIQYGAQLTVRESQMAVFVDEGKIADVFGPGRYTLTTQTLPLLTNLKNWDKLFQSPFKSDVYFYSTRLQLNQKWGTPNPITIRDKEFGAVRMAPTGDPSTRKNFSASRRRSASSCTGAGRKGCCRSSARLARISTNTSAFAGSSPTIASGGEQTGGARSLSQWSSLPATRTYSHSTACRSANSCSATDSRRQASTGTSTTRVATTSAVAPPTCPLGPGSTISRAAAKTPPC